MDEFGPLVPRYLKRERIIMLERFVLPLEYPLGISVHGAVLFDMRADGGVDSIEILSGGPFGAGALRPVVGETYHRLFLSVDGQKAGATPSVEPADFAIGRKRGVLTITFYPGTLERTCLIGPGITARVGNGLLLGIDVDLSPLL